MIRTVVTPQSQDMLIHLPKNFIGKKVEVIAFTIEEEVHSSIVEEQYPVQYASQQVLAKDWLTPLEDAAWNDL